MKVNIIYDDRNTPEDKERLIQEFYEQGITDFKFWDAIVLTDSVVKSINSSQKMVIKWAKDNNIEMCCVIEQDATFSSYKSWQYFLEQMPNYFDIYLGCSYIKDINPNTEVVNNLICGFHLYVVHSSFYDAFLSVPDDAHIDTAVGDLKGNAVFCKPFVALQRSGFSANNKAIVNYNLVLSEEDIYRG